MNTAFNPARQNYVKYDDNHYLLFLNEQETEQTNENGDKVKGYTYTGTRTDGSTLIEATDVTAENMRSKFIAGLIGTEYTKDDQIALLANGEDTNEHAEELAVFRENRRTAKKWWTNFWHVTYKYMHNGTHSKGD